MTTVTFGIAFVFATFGSAISMPLFSGQSQIGSRPPVRLSRGVASGDAEVIAMFSALNAERATRSLRPLDLDRKLCLIAKSFAMEMAHRKFFSHVSPDGDTPFTRMDRAHYRYGYAGENIAFEPNATTAAQALWRSLEHRENILEPHFAHVGIAVVAATEGEIFVEDFSD